MDWLKSLDKYCERVSPEYWAEPINALSNFSFVIAAILIYRLASKYKVSSFGFNFLVINLFLIGVGSFLFHTFANVWSFFADIIPIYIFQLSIVALYGAAIARQKKWSELQGSALLLFAFIVITVAFAQLPKDLLNGSIIYLSAFICLFFLAMYHFKHYQHERYTLFIASVLFILALLCRTIDMEVCHAFPLGSHFMWHLINGAVLFLAVKAYLGVLASEQRE